MYIKADSVADLTPKKIEEVIKKHMNENMSRYFYLYELYKGNHPILERTVTGNKPNNKIVSDFYGKLVDTEVGYFLGKPIVFNSPDEKALDSIGTILVENEFDELIMEVGKEMSIKGKSYILLYQDEESETKMCRISPENIVTLQSRKGHDNIGVAFRHYKELDENENKVIYIEAYDSENIYYFKMQDGTVVLDERYKVNPVSHIFKQVPIFCFKNNEEEMGSIEKVTSLVDAYDKLMSDTSNEHEAYRNAYLVFRNLSADSDIADKLKETGVFEVYDDGDVFFVTKDIKDGAITAHLDRLGQDIHRFSDIPDLTDESFAGNLSGVAIRFKLLGLENKCIIKERKMTKTIRKMFKALNNVISVTGGELLDTTRLQIIFTRNIPNNLTEIVDSVVKLNGIVDQETLLAQLPFIESPIEVIEKLEEEKDTYSRDMINYEDKVFSGVLDNTDTQDKGGDVIE